MSETAWQELQRDLSLVGFPFVNHLGAFRFLQQGSAGAPTGDGGSGGAGGGVSAGATARAMDLFELRSSTDCGVHQRKFGPLRRVEQMAKASLCGVSSVPEGDEIALVALRASQHEALATQPSLTSFRVDRGAASREGSAMSLASRRKPVLEANAELLGSTVRSVAQQFTGFIFQTENQNPAECFVAFSSVEDACRYALALQLTLLCQDCTHTCPLASISPSRFESERNSQAETIFRF